MKIFYKIFIIIIFSSFVSHSFAKDPSEFISEITNAASDILKEDISTNQKTRRFPVAEPSIGELEIKNIMQT